MKRKLVGDCIEQLRWLFRDTPLPAYSLHLDERST